MPEGRPAIPAQLQRDVLIEAGYRCAMPRCRAETLELHHIVDYSKVQEHTFDNLIALCPTCHARVTRGEIDRKAVMQIKANLSVISGRYSEIEQRALEDIASSQGVSNAVVLPGGMAMMMKRLIDDGLFTRGPVSGASMSVANAMIPNFETYVITDKGRAFIERWMTADPLE